MDPALDEDAKRVQRNLARRYFGLAYRYAGGSEQPSLVVLYGLMGSGKTSIARFIRERVGWHMLSTDAVRKQISGVGENTRVYVPYSEGLYSPEMNRKTYEEVCRRAENLLLAGFPVVVDGAFKYQDERLPVIEAAARTNARVIFIQTVCESDEQRRRLEKRAGEIAYSPLFGRLFELTVDVIFGVIHPREVIAFLDECGDRPEAVLFRPFIETLWQSKPEIWGER